MFQVKYLILTQKRNNIVIIFNVIIANDSVYEEIRTYPSADGKGWTEPFNEEKAPDEDRGLPNNEEIRRLIHKPIYVIR